MPITGLSDYSEVQLGNWITGKTTPAAVTARYLALFTAAPTEAGAGTEVSGGGYARQECTSKFPTLSGASGVISNNANIDFGTPSANWGTVTHIGIFDAITAGNLIFRGEIFPTFNAQSGQPVKFESANLSLTINATPA